MRDAQNHPVCWYPTGKCYSSVATGLSASDLRLKCVLSLGSQPQWTLLSYYTESNLRENTLNHDSTDPDTAIAGSDHLLHEQFRPNIGGVLPPATLLTMILLKAIAQTSLPPISHH